MHLFAASARSRICRQKFQIIKIWSKIFLSLLFSAWVLIQRSPTVPYFTEFCGAQPYKKDQEYFLVNWENFGIQIDGLQVQQAQALELKSHLWYNEDLWKKLDTLGTGILPTATALYKFCPEKAVSSTGT